MKLTKAMEEPNLEELTESIQSLTNYRDRLREEVIAISERLRIPHQKINSSLENHDELNKINIILRKLIEQKKSQLKTSDSQS